MEDLTENSERLHQQRRKFIGGAGLPLAVAALAPALFGLQSKAEAATGTSNYVDTISNLRALTSPTSFTMCMVAGHHKSGDGGGGLFYWDSTFLQPQFPSSVSNNVPDDAGTYILPSGHSASTAGRWRRVYDGAVNARWFGALGDNTGRTPSDDRIDISTAPWNVWPNYLTSDTSNNPAYFGFNITAPPFSNTDSWDWIGIQLALFSVCPFLGEVEVGGGTYQLTKTLFLSNGMRATLTGAGMYETVLTKKAGCFNGSTILYLYRIGGAPTTIRGLTFSGPYGGGTTNFNLITQNNTNGTHVENCWLTVCQIGIYYVNSCSDDHVKNCTAEFCETVVALQMDTNFNDEGSDVTVEGCNFWQSAVGQYYTGISTAGGTLQCVGNRFIGFNGASIQANIKADRSGKSIYPSLVLTGNHFLGFNCSSCVLSGDGKAWVVSGNRFVGGAGSAIVSIPDRSVFTGNYIEVINNHACLNILEGAKHTTVTGNTFINSSGGATIEGGLVISVKQGVSWSGGCSNCVITGNTCGAVPSGGTSGINVDSSIASGNVIANNVVT